VLTEGAGLAALDTEILSLSPDMLAPLLCPILGLQGVFLGDAYGFALCSPMLLGFFSLVQPREAE